MGKELSTQTTRSHVAPAVDLPIARELAYRLSNMVGDVLLEELPALLRGKFGHRLTLLREACESAGRNDLEEAVSGLMMRYPSMRGVSPIEAQVMVRAYANDLHGLPLWAIRAAITDIARGTVADAHPDFAPSAPRLRQLAQEHLERPTKEMLDLKKVLTARVEMASDPAMRERVREKFEEFQKQMPRRERSIYAKPSDDRPKHQAMSADHLMEHYAKHDLGFAPKEPEGTE